MLQFSSMIILASAEDIEEQNQQKRLRFANKRNRSFFSESETQENKGPNKVSSIIILLDIF